MTKVAVIGIGFIGKQYVEALREEGIDVIVYDIDESATQWAVGKGASKAASPAKAAEGSNFIVLSLPDTPAVESVMTGPEGVLNGLDDGKLVIDTSTTRPETHAKYEEKCSQRGTGFLSAPLTRGPPGGIHLMVGGSKRNYDKGADIMDIICHKHWHIGGIKAGMQLKLMVQLRYAALQAVDAEAVEFCKSHGIDTTVMNDFLKMDVKEGFLKDDYTARQQGNSPLKLVFKDIKYALDEADKEDIALPLTSTVREILKTSLRLANSEEGDMSTLAKYWRHLNGREWE